MMEQTMIHNDGQVIKISKEENDGIEINGKKCSVYNHELVFGHLRSALIMMYCSKTNKW